MALPVLVAEPQWSRMQARLTATTYPTKRPTRFYLLSRGILRSPCGGTFHGVSRWERGTHHYRCGNSLPQVQNRCGCKRIKADIFDAMIWDYVSLLVDEPERIVPLAEDFLGLGQEADSEAPTRLAEVRSQIGTTTEALGRASATLLAAGADAGTIRAANLELDAELARLRTLESHLEARVGRSLGAKAQAEDFAEFLRTARNEMAVLSDQERRQVLELLDVKVEVHGWRVCPVCDGKGKLKGGDRYEGGTQCHGCNLMRWVPRSTVSGVFTERLADSEVWHARDGVPRRWTC